jgi:hypothetical protein
MAETFCLVKNDYLFTLLGLKSRRKMKPITNTIAPAFQTETMETPVSGVSGVSDGLGSVDTEGVGSVVTIGAVVSAGTVVSGTGRVVSGWVVSGMGAVVVGTVVSGMIGALGSFAPQFVQELFSY